MKKSLLIACFLAGSVVGLAPESMGASVRRTTLVRTGPTLPELPLALQNQLRLNAIVEAFDASCDARVEGYRASVARVIASVTRPSQAAAAHSSISSMRAYKHLDIDSDRDGRIQRLNTLVAEIAGEMFAAGASPHNFTELEARADETEARIRNRASSARSQISSIENSGHVVISQLAD